VGFSGCIEDHSPQVYVDRFGAGFCQWCPEESGQTVALPEPVAAISDCLDGMRETLGALSDEGLTQTLRESAPGSYG